MARKYWFLSFLVVIAFACGLMLISGDAEGADGDGVVNINPSNVEAGSFNSFEIKYTVLEEGFSGTNPGFSVEIPEVSTVDYPGWTEGTDPWTRPTTSAGNRGYVYRDPSSDHYEDMSISVVGRTIFVTFTDVAPLDGLPDLNDNLIIRYGSTAAGEEARAQLHTETNVEFPTQSDTDGDGNFGDTSPPTYVDVRPGSAQLIIMTIKENQVFAPNPYTGVIHVPDTIPDKTVAVIFDAELRLVDEYYNLITRGDGDADLNLQFSGPLVSPEPCLQRPEIQNSESTWTPFYNAIPPTGLTELEMRDWLDDPDHWSNVVISFENGIGLRDDPDLGTVDYFGVKLFAIETDVSIHVENELWYEWNTHPLFNVVGPTYTVTKEYLGMIDRDGNEQTDNDHFITKDTVIRLSSSDLGTGAQIMYRVWYNGEWTEWQEGGNGNSPIEFTMDGLVTVPSGYEVGGDCEHIIEFQAVDDYCLGGELTSQIVHVDNTPPVSDWEFIHTQETHFEHYVDLNADPLVQNGWWLPPGTHIALTCQDEGCEGGVGTEITYYRWWYDADGDGYEIPAELFPDENDGDIQIEGYWYYEGTANDITIEWLDDCMHTLYFWNVDRLGNMEEAPQEAIFWVDAEDPVSDWSIDSFFDVWVDIDTGDTWVDYDTVIEIDCVDTGCDGGVGTEVTYYRWWWDEDGDEEVDQGELYPDSSPYYYYGVYWYLEGDSTYGPPINWYDEECVHYLWYFNVDLLGNDEEPGDPAIFYVDGTSPHSYWDVDDQNYIYQPQTGGNYWLNSDAYILLYCEDYGCDGTTIPAADGSGVGTDYTYYRYWYDINNDGQIDDGEMYPDETDTDEGIYQHTDGEWYYERPADNPYPIKWDYDCEHWLWFFNIDRLGNAEPVGDPVKFYVDSEDPFSWWDVDETDTSHGAIYPSVDASPHEDVYWVNYNTFIDLECVDYGCPDGDGAGTAWTYYRVWWDANGDGIEDSGELDPASSSYEFGGYYYYRGTPGQIQINWADEECIHYLYYFNVDNVNNIEPEEMQTFYVDGTPPVSSWADTTGDIIDGEDNLPANDDGPDGDGIPDWYWIDYETIIWLDCVDEGCPDGDGVGTELTYYRYEWDGTGGPYWPSDDSGDNWYNPNTGYYYYLYDPQVGINWADEECKHELYFVNVDKLGNIEAERPPIVFYVDGTPPVSDGWFVDDTYYEYHYDDSQMQDGWWIPYGAGLYLYCDDYGCEGGVGTDNTYYRYVWIDENGEEHWTPSETGWLIYDEPFYWEEDCEHILYFWNDDLLGNEEEINEVHFWVDGTPPVSSWSVSTDPDHDDIVPGEDGDDEGDDPDWYWIDYETIIWLDCEDEGCDDGVGTEYTYYRWWYDVNLDGVEDADEMYPAIGQGYLHTDGHYYSSDFPHIPLSWDAECVHYLYFFNIDLLGNDEDVNEVVFYVDGEEPSSYSEVDGDDTYLPWIDDGSNINLYCYDYGCDGTEAFEGVGTEWTYYRWWWDADDCGGPCEFDTFVPAQDGSEGYLFGSYYYLRVPASSETPSVTIDWTGQDCTHYLFYFNVDLLGNTESLHSEVYYVDAVAPSSSWDATTGLLIDGDDGDDDGDDPDWYWVNYDTIITLYCSDLGCAEGVGTEETYYRWWWENPDGDDVFVPAQDGSEGYLFGNYYYLLGVPGQIDINWVDQDCIHHLYFFNVDKVGNVEDVEEVIFYVDGKDPVSGWNWVDNSNPLAHYEDPDADPLVQDGYWMAPGDEITLYCNDVGCPDGNGIGTDLTYWRYEWTDSASQTWFYPETLPQDGMERGGHYYWLWDGEAISWSADCEHTIYFFNVDKLLNMEDVNSATFWLDAVPPTSSWEFYGDGNQYPHTNSPVQDGWWITPDTGIELICTDDGCDGGVGSPNTWFRWEKLDPDTLEVIEYYPGTDDSTWELYDGPIYFPDDCLHVLYFYNIDLLGNVEQTTHEAKFWVDGTPPISVDVVFEGEQGECEDERPLWITGGNTLIILDADDYGCDDGVGLDEIRFKILYDGTWYPETSPYYFVYSTSFELDDFELGLEADCLHTIEYWAVDLLTNEETPHQTVEFAVSNNEPDPTVTSPHPLWYYRPGYIINMLYTDTSGEVIDVELWQYSFDGVIWYDIDDWFPDDEYPNDEEKWGVQWNTEDIPAPPCDLLTTNVYVRVKLYNEHCRYGESEPVLIYFCRPTNPHPCEQDFTIFPGWNLISIAVDLDALGEAAPDGYTASILAAEINSQVGENIIKYVVRWDKVNKVFNEYVVDSAIGWDFEINKGEGYYLYSLGEFDETFRIVGDCPKCEYITLDVCWNLVGWNSWEEEMSTEDFAARINAAAGSPPGDEVVMAIVKLVPDLDLNDAADYVAWYPGDTPWMMMPDNAYWIFVSQPVTVPVYFDDSPPT